MVHDLFLYDWRKRENGRKGLHAFTHPHRALEIASSFLELNDKEKEISRKLREFDPEIRDKFYAIMGALKDKGEER